MKLQFSKDLLELLPRDNPHIRQYQEVLTHFNPQDTLVFSLYKKNPSIETDELISVGDALFDSLQSTDLFKAEGLLYRWQAEDVQTLFEALIKHRAMLFGEEDRVRVAEKIQPEQIIKTLDDKKAVITLSPAPFLAANFYNDPLDINSFLYKKLAAAQAAGNHLTTYKGRLFTKAFDHLFIFAAPKSKATDFATGKDLVEKMEQIIKQDSTNNVGIAYLGGHRYALENSNQMTYDINFISAISTVAIIILCFLVFRRPLSVPLVLLPSLFGAALAFGITALIDKSISLVAMGCGSILIGISVDYGVHIIFHADQHSQLTEQHIVEAMRKIFKPLILSTMTTLAAFLCLQLSELPMYQQFGRFAAIGLAAALFFAIVVMPTFLTDLKNTERQPWLSSSKIFTAYFSRLDTSKTPRIILVVVISVICALGLKNLRIDGELRNLYGSTAAIDRDADIVNKALQEELSKTSVVVKADSLEHALKKNDLVAKKLTELKEQKLVEAFSSVSTLLPSAEVQQENFERWQKFWDEKTVGPLKIFLPKQADRLRMQPTFFESFLSNLTNQEEPMGVKDFDHTILAPMMRNQIAVGNETLILTMVKIANFKMYEEVKQLLTKEFKDIIVINSRHLVLQIIDLVTNELVLLGGVTLLAVAALLMMFYGVRAGAMMIIPLLTCLLWSLGVMGWLHLPFNIMNCIMVLFIFGMVEDFSVFLSSAYADIEHTGIDEQLIISSNAIVVSALTTTLSVGALSLADHPALQAVGRTILITLVTGLAAVFIVVPLIHRTPKKSANPSRVSPR